MQSDREELDMSVADAALDIAEGAASRDGDRVTRAIRELAVARPITWPELVSMLAGGLPRDEQRFVLDRLLAIKAAA